MIDVVGVYEKSDAFPNVKNKISGLHEKGLIRHEIFSSNDKNISGYGKISIIIASIKNILKALIVAFKYILLKNKSEIVYIPYPALMVSTILGAAFNFLGKKVVIDAFISVYDTAVNDRRIFKKSSFLAKAIYWLEYRMFARATLVITDTNENSSYYSELFCLPGEKFISCPLAITEVDPIREQGERREGSGKLVRVLFVGTMVPLHGVEFVVEAIKLLAGVDGFHFTFVGKGQAEAVVRDLAKKSNNVTWLSEWMGTESLYSLIRSSDVCLGVFSSSKKADRVIPTKLYLYSMLGKPVITAKTSAVLSIKNTSNPWFLVSPQSSKELRAALLKMKNDLSVREYYSCESRRFYLQDLSYQSSLNSFISLINNL